VEEVKIENKEQYFNAHYPFGEPPKLSEKRRCLHCDSIFVISDYKVFRDENGSELICCPHAPSCDGTIIDWFRLS